MTTNTTATKAGFLRWQKQSKACSSHLLAKKVLLVALILFNFSALYCAFSQIYLAARHCSLITQALTISPLVGGALSILVYLKFPTAGLNDGNASQFLNIPRMIGKVCAFILFAPIVIGMKACNWTQYQDKKVAHEISHDFGTMTFDQIIKNYEGSFDKLADYGFFTIDNAQDLKLLCALYKPQQSELKKYESYKNQDKGNLPTEIAACKDMINVLESVWIEQIRTILELPLIKLKAHADFAERNTAKKIITFIHNASA